MCLGLLLEINMESQDPTRIIQDIAKAFGKWQITKFLLMKRLDLFGLSLVYLIIYDEPIVAGVFMRKVSM